jgi:hypothetical protein
MAHYEEIAALKALNGELVAQHAALVAHVPKLAVQSMKLRARLAKDNHNSGTPPSSDGLGRTRRRACGGAAARSPVAKWAIAQRVLRECGDVSSGGAELGAVWATPARARRLSPAAAVRGCYPV